IGGGQRAHGEEARQPAKAAEERHDDRQRRAHQRKFDGDERAVQYQTKIAGPVDHDFRLRENSGSLSIAPPGTAIRLLREGEVDAAAGWSAISTSTLGHFAAQSFSRVVDIAAAAEKP